MIKTKVIVEDMHGSTPVIIEQHEKCTHTVRKEFGLGYYSKVSLDGDSNMIVEWKHGQGQGRVSIPNGACYDIFEAMKILQAIGRNLTEDITIYKEVK